MRDWMLPLIFSAVIVVIQVVFRTDPHGVLHSAKFYRFVRFGALHHAPTRYHICLCVCAWPYRRPSYPYASRSYAVAFACCGVLPLARVRGTGRYFFGYASYRPGGNAPGIRTAIRYCPLDFCLSRVVLRDPRSARDSCYNLELFDRGFALCHHAPLAVCPAFQ